MHHLIFEINFQIQLINFTSLVMIHGFHLLIHLSSLSSSPPSAISIHYCLILSLQSQNLPFQQILPTLTDFWYLLDCLHGSLDGIVMLIGIFV